MREGYTILSLILKLVMNHYKNGDAPKAGVTATSDTIQKAVANNKRISVALCAKKAGIMKLLNMKMYD